MVFSIAYDRVPYRRELRSNLILQPCYQLNPDQRCIRKPAFHRISKLRTSRLGVPHRAQFLKHSFPPKIMHQRPCLSRETAAQDREILPHRSVCEKLSHQRMSIRIALREQQRSRGKTIDAMHDQSSLSLRLKSRGKQRQRGRSTRTLNRHSQKAGRFVENNHGIVFVKHGKVLGEARRSPAFPCLARPPAGRNSTRLFLTIAVLSRKLLH